MSLQLRSESETPGEAWGLLPAFCWGVAGVFFGAQAGTPAVPGVPGLYGEAAEGGEEFAVDGLVVLDGFRDGDVDDLVVLDTDHHVALIVEEGVDGRGAHARGEDAVEGCRGAAALEVTEDGHAHVIVGIFLFHALGEAHGAAGDGGFGDEHDRRVLRFAEAVLDQFRELVDVGRDLRDDCCLGSGGDGAVEGEEAGVAAHDLDEEEALMAGGRVADLVDAVHDGVQRRVVADGRVGAVEVVVDGAGESDDREGVLVAEDAGTGQRTVAADNDERVDSAALQHVIGTLASFGGLELLASRGLQDCAAALDDVRDVLGRELLDLVRDQTFVTTVDTVYLESGEDGGAGDRTDSGVHARSVTSRCQNTDRFNV